MVRVWNVPVELLDRQRFLGLHNEVAIILYAGIKRSKGLSGGYVNHPETIKYSNRLGELKHLHDNIIVSEFKRRGYNHNSPLREEADSIAYEYFTCTYEESIGDIVELTLRQAVDKVKPTKSRAASAATKMINSMLQ